MKTKISLALAGTIALFTAYSCNGLKEVPDNDIKVESIEFDKTEIYSFVGEELRIEAKINPYNATQKKTPTIQYKDLIQTKTQQTLKINTTQ